jgi:hypothetical protein
MHQAHTRRIARIPHALLAAGTACALMLQIGGCGCEDAGFERQIAQLVVDPDPIVFPVTAARDEAVQVVRLRNAGTSNLVFTEDPILEEFDAGEYATLSKRNVFTPIDCATGEEREASDPHTLRPGDCATLDVVFSPRTTGVVEGMLILTSNDDRDVADNNGRREVPITATASAADIEVCLTAPSDCTATEVCYDHTAGEALQLAFPVTQIDEARSCGVRISNHGDLPLTALGWGFTTGNRYQDFTLDPSDLSTLSIQPGSGVELEVHFSPVSGGDRTGIITVSSSDPVKPAVPIEVVGVGDGPKVCPDPMPIVDFGDVEVGRTVEEMVYLHNCGTMPLDIGEVWITDATGREESDEYALAAGATTTATLQPGEDLLIPVTFSPIFAGQVNGRMYFTSNDPIVPQAFVNLTGRGVIPPACELIPSTENLGFGSAAVGYNPTARTLAVSNVGQLPCTNIEGAITEGASAEFRHVNPSEANQPFHLDVGETAVFNLEYAPQVVGRNDVGVFTIATEDMEDPVLVNLSGTAVAEPVCNLDLIPRPGFFLADDCMSMAFNPRVQQFGGTRIGQDKVMAVTLENVGSAECRVDSARVNQSPSAFPFMPAPPLRHYLASPQDRVMVGGSATNVLQPGEVGEILIRYQPDAEGQDCGVLKVQTDSDDATECTTGGWMPEEGDPGCYMVELRGTGVRATAQPVPGEVDFGVITVDCVSPDREVCIYNTGGVEITLGTMSMSPSGGPFHISGAPPPNTVIPVGGRACMTLTYRPTGNPTTHSGTLTIQSDAENSPHVIPLHGSSTTDTFQEDVFQQLTEPMVDVLWMIDDSCSMQDVQNNLRDNLHVFMQRALDQDTDFQMGVITTDMYDNNKSGRLQGNPRIVDRNNPDPVQALRNNADVGTGGHHIERGFDAAHAALTDPLLNGHNAGFLRDDATLHIIMISDEEEQSAGSVDFFVDFFRNLKGYRNDSLMSVHAIVGDHPGGCSNSYGSAQAAPRYIEAADRTGGLFRSICAPDWGAVADDIGLDAFAARREYFLSREPIPSTIQVRVNGSLVSQAGNWQYHASSNSVEFATSAVPPQGAEVRISYEVLCRQ